MTGRNGGGRRPSAAGPTVQGPQGGEGGGVVAIPAGAQPVAGDLQPVADQKEVAGLSQPAGGQQRGHDAPREALDLGREAGGTALTGPQGRRDVDQQAGGQR